MSRSGVERVAVVALVGIAAYVAIDVALWRLDPWYSLIGNPESDYGVGANAWLMDVNFVLRGAFSLAAAVVLLHVVPVSPARRIGIAGLTAWAVCSAALALFPDHPASTGGTHLLLATLAFLSVGVATIAISALLRGEEPERVGAALLLVATLGGLALLVTFAGARSPAFGLLERVFLGLELIWLAAAMLLALAAVRRAGQVAIPDRG